MGVYYIKPRATHQVKMNTIEIDAKLSKVESFLGAFAWDLLPPKPDSEFSLIINDDKSTLPGNHWLCLVKKNGVLYFIDSYGRDFNDATFDASFSAKMMQYIGDETCIKNKTWLQQLTSNTCALYGIYFINEMQKRSFKSCLAVFTDNLETNDNLVLNYVRTNF